MYCRKCWQINIIIPFPAKCCHPGNYSLQPLKTKQTKHKHNKTIHENQKRKRIEYKYKHIKA